MLSKKFGFDLANYDGVINSTDFNEDWINYDNLGFSPEKGLDFKQYTEKFLDKYFDYDFPESSYFSVLLYEIRNALSSIQNGDLSGALKHLPTGGFEKYGIDNFRSFITNLYKQNRLIVRTDPKSSGWGDPSDTVIFTFEILPYSQNRKSKVDVNKLKDEELSGPSHSGGKEMQNWERDFYKVEDPNAPKVDPQLSRMSQNYLKNKTTMEGKKVIRLTESDLTRIVKRVIEEQDTKIGNLFEKLKGLAQKMKDQLGIDVNEDDLQDTCNCTFDSFEPSPETSPEAVKVFQRVKEKIKQLSDQKNVAELKGAFTKLKSSLDSSQPVNEQIGASIVILGVSAPIVIWVAIGVLVLSLLIKGIVGAISWIPKSSGKGCSKKIVKRVRVKRRR